MSSLEATEPLGGGDPFSRPRRRRWWLPWAVLLPLLLLLLLAIPPALGWLSRSVGGDSQPTSLAEARLAGPRGPSCIRLVAADDLSGSMTEFAGARESAFSMLAAWAPSNLRDDDEFVVVDFARDAIVRQPPVPVTSLSGLPTGSFPDGGSTNLEPVINGVAGLPDSDCDTALLFFSDGVFVDPPAGADQGRAMLQSAGVHDVLLLVPSPDIEVPDTWTHAFPSAEPVRFDGSSADDTSIALGEAIASLTGQQLTRDGR